jgi:hypothetical protein
MRSLVEKVLGVEDTKTRALLDTSSNARCPLRTAIFGMLDVSSIAGKNVSGKNCECSMYRALRSVAVDGPYRVTVSE